MAAQKILHALALCCALCFALPAVALDNPDAPDRVAAFLSRAQVHETEIAQAAQGTGDYRIAYSDYEAFLEEELDQAYRQLMSRLDVQRQRALRNAQRQWRVYREAEFEFIATNWTAEQFGSSAVISRGAYRTTLVKDRVESLLNYLNNYGP